MPATPCPHHFSSPPPIPTACQVTVSGEGLVRVGWSTCASSLQLGMDAGSFGYGGTGKKSNRGSFSDYGQPFTTGDVVGCFLDFEASGAARVAFSKNGVALGEAFTCTPSAPLFPTLTLKDAVARVNFGGAAWAFAPGDAYLGVDALPKEAREVNGSRRRSSVAEEEGGASGGGAGAGARAGARAGASVGAGGGVAAAAALPSPPRASSGSSGAGPPQAGAALLLQGAAAGLPLSPSRRGSGAAAAPLAPLRPTPPPLAQAAASAGSSGGGATSPSIWACKTCSYHNSPGEGDCAMCGVARGTAEGWLCGSCTLLNLHMEAVVCECCQSLRD